MHRECTILTAATALLISATGCAGPNADPEILRRGEVAYAEQDYGGATELLGRYIQADSGGNDLARAHYTRALAHLKIQQRDAAYADLQAALRHASDADIAWRTQVMLGTLYFEDQRWAEAALAYAAAAGKMPHAAPLDEVLWRLGQSYERSGRWQLSRDPFRRLVSDFPNSDLRAYAQRRLALRPTHFSVQCGVFDSPDSARRLAEQLKRQGLPAFVRDEPRGGQRRNVVLVGRYQSYAQAWQKLTSVRQFVGDAIIWP